ARKTLAPPFSLARPPAILQPKIGPQTQIHNLARGQLNHVRHCVSAPHVKRPRAIMPAGNVPANVLQFADIGGTETRFGVLPRANHGLMRERASSLSFLLVAARPYIIPPQHDITKNSLRGRGLVLTETIPGEAWCQQPSTRHNISNHSLSLSGRNVRKRRKILWRQNHTSHWHHPQRNIDTGKGTGQEPAASITLNADWSRQVHPRVASTRRATWFVSNMETPPTVASVDRTMSRRSTKP